MVKLKHKKYCVTGAAGFIGSHIAEEIAKQGKEVVCIDNLVAGRMKNLSPWMDYSNCTFLQWDVRDQENMVEALKGVDVVFHNAASKCTVCRKDPAKDLMVNAMGSFNVFEAARINKVKKVVHASTGSVNKGEPVSFYGVSKLAGESYLRAFNEYYKDFRFTSIRYHHVFGPRQEAGDDGGVIPIFIRKMLRGLPVYIYGDGYQERHFTYVKDVVECNFAAETLWDGKFINYAEHEATTINELVIHISKITGKLCELVYKDSRAGDIRKFDIADNVCLKSSDYYQRFEDNLKKTIKYYE